MENLSRRSMLISLGGLGILQASGTGIASGEDVDEVLGIAEYKASTTATADTESTDTTDILHNGEVQNAGVNWTSNSSVEVINGLEGSFEEGDWDDGIGLTSFGPAPSITDTTLRIRFRLPVTDEADGFPFGLAIPGDPTREVSLLTHAGEYGWDVELNFFEYYEKTIEHDANILVGDHPLYDGEWHEVWIPMDYEEGKIYLYIDGEFIGTDSVPDWSIDSAEIWGVGLTRSDQPNIEIDEFDWIEGAVHPSESYTMRDTIVSFPCLFGGPVVHDSGVPMVLDSGGQNLSDIGDQILEQTSEITDLYSGSIVALPQPVIDYLFEQFVKMTIEDQTQYFLDDILDKVNEGDLDERAAMEILERIRCERQINKIALANLSSESLSIHSDADPLHDRTLIGVERGRFAGEPNYGLNHQFTITLIEFLLTIFLVSRAAGIAAKGGTSGSLPSAFRTFGAIELATDVLGLSAEALHETPFFEETARAANAAPDPESYSDESEYRRAIDDIIVESAKPVENIFNLIAMLGASGITSAVVSPLERRTTVRDIHSEFRRVGDLNDLNGDLAECRDAVSGSTIAIEKRSQERVDDMKTSVLSDLTDIGLEALFHAAGASKAVVSIASRIGTSPLALTFESIDMLSILKHMSYIYGENDRGLRGVKEGDY